MAKVYLGFGSNLGDRKSTIQKAMRLLAEEVKIEKISPFYETEPVGYLRQQWFVNCVIEGETLLPPYALLKKIKFIERKLGKKFVRKNGPRSIDIDILLYGKQKIKSKKMEIPHPRFHERAFVLVPFAQIAPMERHPLLLKTAGEFLSELKTKKQVKKMR